MIASHHGSTLAAIYPILVELVAILHQGVEELAPVNGQTTWMVPFYAFISFGMFGIGAAVYSSREHSFIRLYLLIAGTACVLMQYIFLAIELRKYPESFAWYDAVFVLWHLLLLPGSWSSPGNLAFLVVPALGIIATTLALPVLWRRYRQDR